VIFIRNPFTLFNYAATVRPEHVLSRQTRGSADPCCVWPNKQTGRVTRCPQNKKATLRHATAPAHSDPKAPLHQKQNTKLIPWGYLDRPTCSIHHTTCKQRSSSLPQTISQKAVCISLYLCVWVCTLHSDPMYMCGTCAFLILLAL
jgi:hypothetical protein